MLPMEKYQASTNLSLVHMFAQFSILIVTVYQQCPRHKIISSQSSFFYFNRFFHLILCTFSIASFITFFFAQQLILSNTF